MVITGLALLAPEYTRSLTETTRVTFRELADQEIEDYVASGEPLDKAGAYAIQGGASKFGTYSGSLTNVIGLPMEALELELRAYLGSAGYSL